MTKNILLTAVATTALALSAFSAQANELTLSVGGVDVSDDALVIATEAPFNTNALRTAEVIATVDYNAATFPAGNNLVITYTLGGGAVFGSAVTAADLVGFDDVLLSSGGGIGSTSVVFLVDVANDDVVALDFTGVQLTADVRFAAGNTSPTLTVETTTEADTPIEGGFATVDGDNDGGVLIARATGFDIDIVAAVTENEAKIDADFEAYDAGSTDFVAELGTIEVDYAADVYSSFVAGAAVTIATTNPFNSADVTIDGLFTNQEIVDSGGADTDVDANVLTIESTGLGDVIDIELELSGIASASDYSASVTLDLDAGWTPANPAATGDLNEITREGSSFMVAWVASGTLSATSGTNNVIRVSNESAFDAAVLLEVTASATVQGVPPTFTPGIVDAGVVPAGGEKQFTSAQLQTLLGGDFRRSDIRVIVEADQEEITVLRQVVQPNNVAAELTVTPE